MSAGESSKLMEVAQRIREMREIFGMTESEMAQKTEVSVEEYCQYEAGKLDFPFTFIHKCSLAFGIGITDLLEGQSARLHSYTITRKGEGQEIQKAHGMTYFNMAARFKKRVAEPLYYYYQHATSTVHYISEEKCSDRMRSAHLLVEECKKRGFLEAYKKEIEYRFTELHFQFRYFLPYLNRSLEIKLSTRHFHKRFQFLDFIGNILHLDLVVRLFLRNIERGLDFLDNRFRHDTMRLVVFVLNGAAALCFGNGALVAVPIQLYDLFICKNTGFHIRISIVTFINNT